VLADDRSGGPWPQANHDSQGTRRSPADSSANQGKLAWKLRHRSTRARHARHRRGWNRYAGSYDGNLYAIGPPALVPPECSGGNSRPATGATGSWPRRPSPRTERCTSARTTERLRHRPPASGTAGELKWSFPTGDTVRCSPTIGRDGTLYVGADDYNLYALDPRPQGKPVSSSGASRLPVQVETAPAIGPDGTVYVGSSMAVRMR